MATRSLARLLRRPARLAPRPGARAFAVVVIAAVALAACGGGGSTVPSSPTATPVSGPTATATPASQTQTVTVGVAPATANYTAAGDTMSVQYPTASASTPLTTTFTTAQPSGTPTIQSLARRPQNIGQAPLAVLAYVCVTPNATVTLNAIPGFSLTLPAAITGTAYLALFTGSNPSAGWNLVGNAAQVTNGGSTLSSPTTSGSLTLNANVQSCFAIFTLASSLPSPSPSPTSTATSAATPTSVSPNAFTCPANDASADSVAVATSGESSVRRANGLHRTTPSWTSSSTTLLAVTYKTADLASSSTRSSQVASRESAAGGTLVNTMAFDRLGTTIHMLAVPSSQTTAVASSLRTQSGVVAVGTTGQRRYSTAVSTSYWPNDPYFNGFTTAQNEAAQGLNVDTFQAGPYEEASNVPGEWDMHAIGLEKAWAYSLTNNGSGIVNAGALGSNTVKIAIIDTGEDPNHPELASKIAYQHCYITNYAGNNTPGPQSSSSFETDPLGHGTDVSGIAAADTNNDLGFVGVGGNVVIYAYRVFPTPDDNCASDSTGANDPQCGAATQDIASAIGDAVAQGVNVISMSLGGSTCSSPGVDSDMIEGAAVENAISHNVIVVAASGNSGGSGVASPACDSGVIAVGATSLDDGTANGTGSFGGTSASPVEYMAAYAQYGTTSSYRSTSSWGLVAPGGDPSNAEETGTADDLHWIEHIWTTTPYRANANDTNFIGECTSDYPNSTGSSAPDCRTLIAGTSMATPHVAGAAALIISATGATYASPAAMFNLLCTTTDELKSSSGQVTGQDQYQGCGRLNVYRAMATALGDPNEP